MNKQLPSFSKDSKSYAQTAHSQARPTSSWLEQMPNEILANVGFHLPSRYRDPSLALQTMGNLVQTSKKMHATFNDYYVTHLFLTACIEEYGGKTAEFAAQLKTAGARAWLEDYIQKNCLEDAYSAFQKLKLLALELVRKTEMILSQVSQPLLHCQVLTPQSTPHSAASLIRTTKGFVLGMNWEYLTINHLFGAIEIYTIEQPAADLRTIIPCLAITLIRYLDITFQGFATIQGGSPASAHLCCGTAGKIQEMIVPRSNHDTGESVEVEIKKVDIRDLAGKRGCQNIILHRHKCQHSFYASQCAFGHMLPNAEVEERKSTKPSPQKLIKTLLHLLESRKVRSSKSPQTGCVNNKKYLLPIRNPLN